MYETRNIGVSALLLCRGHRLTELRRDPEDRRFIFCFPDPARADADGYYGGAMVEARSFSNALRDIKQLMKERRHG